MSTIVQSNFCNLCGKSQFHPVYQAEPEKSVTRLKKSSYAISESHLEKPEKIVQCSSCGLIFAYSNEGFSAITRDYADMVDQDYLAEEKGRRAQARSVLRQIVKFKSHGTLLDIGCGPAFLLDEAKHKGFQTSGVDLSAWAKQHAQEHYAIDVFCGSLESALFPNRQFDVIVINDVIEHVEDPKKLLTEIRRILKNDGILYISTPDIQSLLSRLLRAKWWGINKYHLFYFSRKTLAEMFRVVGFKKLKYSSYPRVFSVRYWAKRLEGYPAFVRLPFAWAACLGNMGDRLLKVELHDQIGVVAKKIQRLDSVIVDEVKREIPLKKMKVAAVLPAYNAAKTLERTVADIPREVVDEIILVDDQSKDDTVQIARKIGLVVFEHEKNLGYGGNQKTCYEKAIELGADIVVMVHPDYQYDPKMIPRLVEPIQKGEADAVFGSRMIKGGALLGGMPVWKHNANILLTAFENVMLGTYLTEYHSGFRAYSTKLLKSIRYKENSNNFIFDTQIIVQILTNHFKIEEIPIRTRYFEEASSIRLWPSIVYGLGILRVMLVAYFHNKGWIRNKAMEPV